MAAAKIKATKRTLVPEPPLFDPNATTTTIAGPSVNPKSTLTLEPPLFDPRSTAPVSGKNFVGPTLDPSLTQARRALSDQQITALRGGVDPAIVSDIAGGGQNPNRGFIGPAKAVGGFLKKVGTGIVPDVLDVTDIPLGIFGTDKNLGQVAGPALGKAGLSLLKTIEGPLAVLDFGKKFVLSTLKEIGDEGAALTGNRARGNAINPKTGETYKFGGGGFSPSDWVNQTFAGSLGIGEKGQEFRGGDAFADIKNPYINQTLGFFAEVLLDPVTWLTGPGGIAKTAAGRGVFRASAEVSKAALAAEVARGTAIGAKEAAELASREAARKALSLRTPGAIDAAKIAAAEAKEAAEYAAKLTPEIILKNAAVKGAVPDITNSIRLAEEAATAAADKAAKAAADVTAAIAADAAAKTAAKRAAAVAKAAAKELAKQNAKTSARSAARLYGRTGKEALANSIREIRQKALDDIAVAAPGDVLDYANAAVAALTDDVIAKVAKDGYAGLTGSLGDIIRGVKTPAQEVLGVQGGIRFGVGANKVIIPGTGVLTDVLGMGVAGTKGVLKGGRVGNALLESITPTGAGGLFGEEDLLKLRTGLSNGSLKGTNAAQASELLSLDKTFRGRVELTRKAVGSILTDTFGTGDIAKSRFESLQEIADYLRVPEAQWAARGLAPLTSSQRTAYTRFTQYLNKLDDITREVAQGTGGFVAAREVLPAVQTTQATRWLANNPRLAEKLAKELNLEADALLTLTGAQLKVGDKFFGRTLTDIDIEGGIKRLNEIARESTQKLGKGINFDFFDNDIARSIARYSDNQARAFAKAKIIGELPPSETTLFPAGAPGIGMSSPAIIPGLAAPRTNVFVTPANLATLEGRVAAVAADLSQWNAADITALYAKLRKIESTVKSTLKPEFNRSVADATKYIDDIEAGIAAGIIDPSIAAVAGDEATKFATLLAQGTEGITKTLAATTPDRWRKVADIVYDGFVKLDAINAPGVEVHPAIAELFTNIKRLDDPQFAAQAEKLLREYNQFFKSYVTATPGFHARNALGATIQMISGGADPVNSTRGVLLYANLYKLRKANAPVREIVEKAINGKFYFKGPVTPKAIKDLEDILRSGGVPRIIEEAVISELIPNTFAARKGLEDILLYSQATGFGQIGEVTERIPGLRPGIFGTTPTGDIPILERFPIKLPVTKPDSKIGKVIAKLPAREDTIFGKVDAAKLSETWGTPLYASRKFGAGIENTVRFAMMFDGVAKGLSPQEAAARTAKFLIDYSDISSVDKVAKQIIPFWMWMTRNTALQAELIWTNPRVYKAYDTFRDNFEDKEGTSPYVPDYLKDTGAFKIGGTDNTYFKSPFGLIGRGEESVITSTIENPLKFLSRVTPALKVPAELFRNEKFFTGAPIVKDGEGNALLYAFQQLDAPGQLINRLTSFTKLRRNELFQTLTGGTSAEVDPRAQELNSLWSLIGAPGFKLTPDQEKGEIWRRFFDLEDLINKAKANKQKEK